MPDDYWLGLLTIPAVLGACWLLWQAGRFINRVGDRMFRRIPLGPATKRAQFAGFVASTRRAQIFTFGGVGVAFMAGYDGSNVRRVHDAVLPLLADRRRAPQVRPVGQRTPHDPGIDFDSEDD